MFFPCVLFIKWQYSVHSIIHSTFCQTTVESEHTWFCSELEGVSTLWLYLQGGLLGPHLSTRAEKILNSVLQIQHGKCISTKKVFIKCAHTDQTYWYEFMVDKSHMCYTTMCSLCTFWVISICNAGTSRWPKTPGWTEAVCTQEWLLVSSKSNILVNTCFGTDTYSDTTHTLSLFIFKLVFKHYLFMHPTLTRQYSDTLFKCI